MDGWIAETSTLEWMMIGGRVLLVLLTQALLWGCEDRGRIERCAAEESVFSDSRTALFDSLAKRLEKNPRGSADYWMMADERNRCLRNIHSQLRGLAEDRLTEGMLSGTSVPEHWDLICRWYGLMKLEESRLKFAGLLDVEKERAYVRFKIGLGRRMSCYGDKEQGEILRLVRPYLGDDFDADE